MLVIEDITQICIPAKLITKEHQMLLEQSISIDVSYAIETGLFYYFSSANYLSADPDVLALCRQRYLMPEHDVALGTSDIVDAYIKLAVLTVDPKTLLQFYLDTHPN